MDGLDALPGWSYMSMVAPAADLLRTRYGATDLTVRLLAWLTMENDRAGLKVDEALLWYSYFHSGTRHWALAHVFRHPYHPHRGERWELNWVTDTPWQPIRVYERPPTNADVYAFTREHWSWGDPPPFFIVLGAAVRERTWRSTIGEEPMKGFKVEK
jgi:hypothetical protein